MRYGGTDLEVRSEKYGVESILKVRSSNEVRSFYKVRSSMRYGVLDIPKVRSSIKVRSFYEVRSSSKDDCVKGYGLKDDTICLKGYITCPGENE